MKSKAVKAFSLFVLTGILLTGCRNGSKDNADLIASAEEMVTMEEVVEEGMEPIPGTSLKDGVYEVTVDSSSSMFRILQCELTVENGKMSAVMMMSGSGYLKVFMGTGREAVEASEADHIPAVDNGNGTYTFTVPVKALDQGIDCAAFSRNKEKWYERILVFRANSLPLTAFSEDMITTVESLALEDGLYTAEVTLGGGSGKAKVESPAQIRVENYQAYANILWGSHNYDYMKVNGEKYLQINTEGNSAFEIPVNAFDWKLAVIADTVAMSVPHEIDYTLYFDSETLTKVSE